MNHHTKVFAVVLLSYSFTLFAFVQKVSAESSPSPKQLEYKLPYPGLLPDNPLCFFKNVRDNFSGFFISKPLDKATFALLQSDKQVSASYLLITQEQEKADLAQSSFSQSQDYFEEAITQTIAAKKQGTDISEMAKRLEEANKKHIQILQMIEKQVSPDDKKKFQIERERAQGLSDMVAALPSN